MSGNRVDHALLTLSKHYIGVPTAPLAEQYALISAAQTCLEQVIYLVKPHIAYVANADKFAYAIKIDALDNVKIVASQIGSQTGLTNMAFLL